MKVCPLTTISSPAPKICLNALLSGDEYSNTRSFWKAESFRYFMGLWSVWSVNLLPARCSLKHLTPHTTASHSFSMIWYLASDRLNLLA